jgi:hypothetical protein
MALIGIVPHSLSFSDAFMDELVDVGSDTPEDAEVRAIHQVADWNRKVASTAFQI